MFESGSKECNKPPHSGRNRRSSGTLFIFQIFQQAAPNLMVGQCARDLTAEGRTPATVVESILNDNDPGGKLWWYFTTVYNHKFFSGGRHIGSSGFV